MESTQTKTWHQVILQDTNQLAEQFGLDEQSTNQLRSFVVTTAKNQYRVGNKSGAAWAFKQAVKTE